MTTRPFTRTILGILLAALAAAPGFPGADAPRLDDPEFWRRQALDELIPHWYANARDLEHGAFYMNLARDWTPEPPWDKVPALISRHVYGFSAAYLLSGDDQYLAAARAGAEYLLAQAWDPKYGGWFDKLARDGKPLVETKTVSLQLYTNVGLTMYAFVSGDRRALDAVLKSVEIQFTRARDAERGGFAQALGRDLAVLDAGKNKHAHYGYLGSLLLNLYLGTRDPAVLAKSRELADLSIARLRDAAGWYHGFRNRHDRAWRRTPSLVDGREVASIGAQLTAALAFLRLYHQTGDTKYLDEGRRIGERAARSGRVPETGAWLDLVDAAPPFGAVAKPTVWWWVQIYGAFLELQLYGVTGDPGRLEDFRRSEEFFDRFFLDREKGGVFGSVAPDGALIGQGRKASDGEWHTSYHEIEHALLNYLYLSLYVHRRPAVLHFKLDGPARHLVSFVDDPSVRIEAVKMDGRPWKDFDARDRSVSVPPGAGHVVEVTLGVTAVAPAQLFESAKPVNVSAAAELAGR